MRFARNVKNAFTIREVSDITGLPPAMLNFLIRNEYLNPSYREDHDLPEQQKRQPRGNTRYCSYRDLMIAKTIQRLLNAGVQLIRVKEALADLRADKHWLIVSRDASVDRAITWLVTDGKKVYLQNRKEPFLEPLGKSRQKAFSFILDMTSVRSDVRTGIQTSRIPKCREKIAHFKLANEKPIFDPERRRVVSRNRIA
jgi:DNA-binding transcriptional MerR regulator